MVKWMMIISVNNFTTFPGLELKKYIQYDIINLIKIVV